MKLFQSLNEIESSPFFTASWEPRFLKKLLLIFGSWTAVFLLISGLFVKTYFSIPLFFTGKDYRITLTNTINSTLPHMIVLNSASHKKLSIDEFIEDETYYLSGHIYQSTGVTRYFTGMWADPIRYRFNKNSTKYDANLYLLYPPTRYAQIVIRIICFIVCVFSAFFSYMVPNLKSFFPLYLLVCIYSFFSLPFFQFSLFRSSLISMTFWFGFISISFLEVRILSSNISVIYMSLFGIAAACGVFASMTYENPTFIYPSLVCLLILIGVSLYMFYLGTSILSPFLLSVHFGWMWAIGMSVYLSTILRTMTVFGIKNFFINTISYVITTVFLVFQSIYLVGEPNKAKIPEAPLDQAAHLNRIDHLLEVLAEKDENGSKRNQAFQ